MAEGRIKNTDLSAIAAAIRSKNGSSTTYKPGEMAQAILDIPTGTTPTGTVNITQNGTTDVTQYASANVNVPNSYGQSDEGKVVSNGALVAQGTDTVTENGTVDTTLISSLVVNVSGGGGGEVIYTETKIQEAGVSSKLTLEQTVQIQHTGTYFISIVGHVDDIAFKINGVQQILVHPANYSYYYTNSSIQLQQGDSLYFYLDGTGRIIESVSVVRL